MLNACFAQCHLESFVQLVAAIAVEITRRMLLDITPQ